MDPVADFLDWATRAGRSPHTLSRYRITLAQIPDPLNITREAVEEWWKRRYEDGAAPATRANELACLRTFYKWALRFDHRIDDPTRRLDAPPVDNAYPRPIGRSDLQRALDACDEKDAPELRRALALGAYGGLRVSEAASLDWDIIDLDNRFMRIRGKGRKERIAGLSPKLLDEILPNTGGNVVMAGGNPYSADTLQRRVNRHLKGMGVEHTFHSLRARYVTQGIADTGDIFAVSRAVGWSSIETARSYAALSDDALHRIAAAASR
ncbi:MAG: tyrosine-type recombinase/integrase [Naasia sp.]